MIRIVETPHFETQHMYQYETKFEIQFSERSRPLPSFPPPFPLKKLHSLSVV